MIWFIIAGIALALAVFGAIHSARIQNEVDQDLSTLALHVDMLASAQYTLITMIEQQDARIKELERDYDEDQA